MLFNSVSPLQKIENYMCQSINFETLNKLFSKVLNIS